MPVLTFTYSASEFKWLTEFKIGGIFWWWDRPPYDGLVLVHDEILYVHRSLIPFEDLLNLSSRLKTPFPVKLAGLDVFLSGTTYYAYSETGELVHVEAVPELDIQSHLLNMDQILAVWNPVFVMEEIRLAPYFQNLLLNRKSYTLRALNSVRNVTLLSDDTTVNLDAADTIFKGTAWLGRVGKVPKNVGGLKLKISRFSAAELVYSMAKDVLKFEGALFLHPTLNRRLVVIRGNDENGTMRFLLVSYCTRRRR